MATILGTCIAVTTPTVFAQETAPTEEVTTDAVATTEAIDDDVFDMSLDELLNMEITVASKKAEKLSDAPGSITAYSANDVEKMGYYTLADLASITAGYSAPKGLNVSQFETRGQYTSGGFDNNKHLILVDGIPVYNARANMASSEEVLPLLGFKRIEFLRGPGSALYGIGAFNGVINVVSKDLEENGTMVDGKISLGDYDGKRRIMLSTIHKTDIGVAKISAGYYSKESTQQYLGGDGYPDSTYTYQKDALARYQDYNSSTYLNGSFKLTESLLKGLTTGVIYQKRESGLGEWWMDQQNQTYPFTESQFEQFIPYLKYERQINDKLSINSYLKKNYSYEKYAGSNGWQAAMYWSGAGLSFFKLNVNETEGFIETRYEANEKLSLTGGLNIVSRYGTGAPDNYIYYVTKDQGTLYNYSADFSKRTSTYNTYSVFGQAQYKVDFLAGLNITAGARMDMGRVLAAKDGETTNKYNQLSPRVALVQKVTEKINVKAMYGKALRAPMIKEVGGNEEAKNILLRDTDPNKNADAANVPELGAETIDSYEAAVTYNDKMFGLAATVFMNFTENAMYRGETPGVNGSQGQAILQNISGTIKGEGIEFEASVLPIKNIRLSANYATATVEQPQVVVNTDTISGGKPFNTPTQKINGVASYTMFAPIKMSVALMFTHISGYNVGGFSPWRKSGSTSDDFNAVYGGQSLLDLNIRGEVTENLSLELQVRNLTGAEYQTPAFFGSRKLNVPGAGRSFLVTVGYKF